MTLTERRFLRQHYIKFSEIYADYTILRARLLRTKMEREHRRRLALEMGKVLEQYGFIVRDLMKELERKS